MFVMALAIPLLCPHIWGDEVFENQQKRGVKIFYKNWGFAKGRDAYSFTALSINLMKL